MQQIDERAMPTGPMRAGSGAATTTSDSLENAHLAVTEKTSDRLQDEYVLEELLVEDVSIDGMCGVY